MLVLLLIYVLQALLDALMGHVLKMILNANN